MSETFKKITGTLKRRGMDWVTAKVPYNHRRFAAVGVEKVCRNSSAGSDCLQYSGPKSETVIRFSRQLYDQTSDFMHTDEYDLVKKAVSVNARFCAWKIQRGRVYSNNSRQFFVLSQANKIVTGASYNHDAAMAGVNPDQLELSARFYPEPVKFSGRAGSLILGGGPSTNIFHWMMDALPRLKLIEKICPLGDVDHFLVQGADNGFRLRSLELLGIPASKVHFFTDQLIHVQADELLVGSHPRGWLSNISPDWSVAFHRDRYLPKIKPLQRQWPKKIYISRRDSRLRGVENENEVMKSLDARGYQQVLLSEYGYDEKIALFYHADEVVSMSGAGLAFLVYCRPQTHVLELFPTGFVHYANAALASQAELNYLYLVFGNSDMNSESQREAQRLKLTVDLEKVTDILDDWNTTE